jgi:hypothetical protein
VPTKIELSQYLKIKPQLDIFMKEIFELSNKNCLVKTTIFQIYQPKKTKTMIIDNDNYKQQLMGKLYFVDIFFCGLSEPRNPQKLEPYD